MNKLAIATPLYGGKSEYAYLTSMMQLVARFAAARQDVSTHFLANESLIQRGRNALVHDFLKTDYTHLMFIDGDIGFDPTDIFKMLDADKPIIGGIYPMKTYDTERLKAALAAGVPAEALLHCAGKFVYRALPDVPLKFTEPCRVQYLGTGFMLIKREVFEVLKPHVETYYPGDSLKAPENLISAFFDCPIKNQELLSEDFFFTHLAAQHGFDVWALPSAFLTHTGPHEFGPCLFCSHGQFIHEFEEKK